MPITDIADAAYQENKRALLALLGLSEGASEHMLDTRILISTSDQDITGAAFASDVEMVLARTFRNVSVHESLSQPHVELVVGSALSRSTATVLYATVAEDSIRISDRPGDRSPSAPVHSLLRLIGACYACAAIMEVALASHGSPRTLSTKSIVFSDLGITPGDLVQPFSFDKTYLAGAGAIGNAFVLALSRLNVEGALHIVDDDLVEGGNLNRQLFFSEDDVGEPKAERLCLKAQPLFPALRLHSHRSRLESLEGRYGAWLERLVVAVDSRRARRRLQNELPREVFDASTTGIDEVVIHYNCEPISRACMACIYHENDEETSREQHIATALGVTADEVRAGRVSPKAARAIVAKNPTIDATAIAGLAYDTLFKQLCGQGALPSQSGAAVVAPFAFVSCLAGALLALEVVRRLGVSDAERSFNYWRVSPWFKPLATMRQNRATLTGCEFCGNDLIRKIRQDLWINFHGLH